MTPEPTVLRAAVVGLGVMGTHHARVLDGMPGVELVAAVDSVPTRRQALQRRHPGVAVHADLEGALAGVDVCAVAVPVAHLAPVARAALAADTHVLVEKPTAPTEGAASELVADAHRRGLVLGVGHVERANPAVLALRQKMEEGLIGDVVHMHARRLSPFPNRASMHGVALDLATHDIDVMRFITGREVDRVFAEVTALHEETTEDLLCATLRFGDGPAGLLEANWITPTKIRELSVTGTGGMLVVDYLQQELRFYEHPTHGTEWAPLAGLRGGGEGNMVRFALERREPLLVQWEGFLDAVRTGARPPVAGADGIASLSVARAIQESGARGEVVVPAYRTVSVE